MRHLTQWRQIDVMALLLMQVGILVQAWWGVWQADRIDQEIYTSP